MTRKQFILNILAGIFWIFGFSPFQTFFATATTYRSPTRSIQNDIEGLFSNVEHARAIGNRYLSRFPDQADHRLLLQQSILKALPQGSFTESLQLKKALQVQRGQEFLTGNIIILDGWVLARSEISLCALLALPRR